MDKLKDLTLGEKIIGASAVVMLVNSFLPWYRVDLGAFGSVSRNGWQSPGAFWSIFALLFGLALLAAVLVRRLGLAETPDKIAGLSWGTLYLIGGGASLIFVVFKWIGESSFVSIGFYLGLLCAIGLAVGGFLAFQEERQETSAPGPA